jgi:endogenous inhibitor of DNA gyrase (YacG/DUF329 family)
MQQSPQNRHRWIAVPELSPHTQNISGETRRECPTCSIRSSEASPVMPAREALAKIGTTHKEGHCDNDAINVPCPICGYPYGSAWVYAPIPDPILAEIRAWLSPVEAKA